jgi:hypothetical protein
MRLVISRNQYEKLKEIFEQYEVDQVVWTEENISGIGPNVTVEFDPTKSVKVDLTDYSSW